MTTTSRRKKENKIPFKHKHAIVKREKKLHDGTTKMVRRRVRTLRPSLTPGTILILLNGIYRGRRVVFLKHLLCSNMLMCTGPFLVNGFPLRRVNPKTVIATSKKVDVSSVVNNLDKYDDYYFTKSKAQKREERKAKQKRDESLFMSQGQEAPPQLLPQENKENQQAVDKPIIEAVKKDKDGKILMYYLKSKFTLTNTMYPHLMKF